LAGRLGISERAGPVIGIRLFSSAEAERDLAQHATGKAGRVGCQDVIGPSPSVFLNKRCKENDLKGEKEGAGVLFCGK